MINFLDELLRINDDLNGSFLRYERYERSVNFQKNPTGASASPPTTQGAAAAGVQTKIEPKSNPSANATTTSVAGAAAVLARGQSANEKSLIDFEEEEFDPLSNYNRMI